MVSKSVFGSFVAGLVFSSLSSAYDYIPQDQLPEWFQTEMLKDTTVTESSVLDLGTTSKNARVLGKATLVANRNDALYYHIDVETSSPVECYAFSASEGAANSLYSVLRSTAEALAETNQLQLVSLLNYASDVGVVGSTAYLGLELLYVIGEQDDPSTGLLKGLVAQTGDTLQICLHHEIGYRSAFFSVFRSFVDVFASTNQSADFFRTVYKHSLGDVPIGYVWETFALDEDGDVHHQSVQSMLMPVDESSVSRSDLVMSEWSSPDGSLINSSEYTIENGDVSSEFAVFRHDDAWHVEGQMQGKEIETTLEYDSWLLSSFGQYLETAIIRTTEKSESEFMIFLAEADPTAATPIIISETKDKKNANMQMRLGPMVFYMDVDAGGIVRETLFKQGPISMNMPLLYSSGTPLLQ
ncbi:MAG: hypothetical protein AAF699_18030 [Pseudomonadota bacterium]